MLQTSDKRLNPRAAGPVQRAAPDTLDPASLWRHRYLALSTIGLAVLFAALYLALRSPSYTATARVIVDNRILQMTSQNSVYTTSATSTGWGSAHVLSQVEVLRSQRVAQRAIAALDQQGHPLSVSPQLVERLYDLTAGLGPAPHLLRMMGAKPATMRSSLDARKVDTLRRQMTITRIGETFAIEIRGQSDDAEEAARLTNAVVTAYLDEIAVANAEAAKGASGWLRDVAREAGSTAWIISEATAPLERDGPHAGYVLAVALVGGGLCGAALAFGRDVFDRRIRTPEQFAAILGVECFGDAGQLPNPTCEPEIAERIRVALVLERRDVRNVGFCPLSDRAAAGAMAWAVAAAARAHGQRVETSVAVNHTGDADFVVVTLPPAHKAAAVRAALPALDAVILVADAGGVARDEAERRIAALGPIESRLVGCVLATAPVGGAHV